MKIIFVGGGTAGHINPALALASYVRKKDPSSKILYIGAKGGMEERLANEAGFEFKGITISGFSRKINLKSIKKNFKTLKNIIISTFESRKILKDFNPDICVGTGGYVCGPFLREAYNLKIPFIIHDSNSFPGVTTKLLAKKASRVLIINEEVKKYLPKNINISVTGTPVRESILNLDKETAKKSLGLNENPTILSFGGSLGAKSINNVMAQIITKKKNNFNFIHGFGKSGSDFLKDLEKSGIDTKNDSRYIVKEYISNMNECLAAADLVICRAGATTLSEIEASSKPAILIPSPNVAENHQYYNALTLKKMNAASLIEEKDLSCENLYEEIEEILNTDKKDTYAQNLEKIAIKDADRKIYDIITEILKESK